MRLLTRHMLRASARPLLAAWVVMSGLGVVVGVSMELLRAPVRPPAQALPELALVTLPITWASGLPVAALVGLSAALWRWRRDGHWVSLQALGVSGRGLIAPTLGLALCLSGAMLALSHWGEPAARARTRSLLVEELRPVPGRLIQLGDATLSAEGVRGEALEGVVFALERPEGPLVGSARAGQLSAGRLVLEHGRLLPAGGPPSLLTFERLEVALDLAERRVELVERSDASLSALVERMRARGKAADYELAVLLKRWSWPASAGLMLLACPPLVLRGRLPILVALPFVYWATVRGFDGLARSLGGELVAWAPTGLLAAWIAALWWRWEAR